MERYICIHGHFYQPPRENPWLEIIEIQDDAFPYHDWNKRITAECYAANAASRILDDRGKILSIVNNYAGISFNFGPTLLSWLEKHSPDVYQDILRADKESARRFFGHGSAMAQAYNHMIMPLANKRDKETQILWGIRDFEHRFGRHPEGMWLPETAVDLETLEILADHGIKFTVLAPGQARMIRVNGRRDWIDVQAGGLDPRIPYRIDLPSGKPLALFFYDGNTSRAVAFEKLLSSGEAFALRLAANFDKNPSEAQLVHIATDGESYGHHHQFGDMALAYALHYIEAQGLARLTNYGEFLERHPPEREALIFEGSSWSCAHGVERWRSDCGCNTGAHPTWNQSWRAPLRGALDALRDSLTNVFQEVGPGCLKDIWAARNGYIDVILDRTEGGRRTFLESHALEPSRMEAARVCLKLMELQRQSMLMYTSCGWFFDDISGIETLQILQYAARAIELAREIRGKDLEPEFMNTLARAKSNKENEGTGRDIYLNHARRGMVDIPKIAAHYAMSSLFDDTAAQDGYYCFLSDEEEKEIRVAGKAKLLLGHSRFISQITLDDRRLTYGALHLGDHNLSGGVGEFSGPAGFSEMVEDITRPFERGDFHETLRRFDRHFGKGTLGIKSLFRDERRRILNRILGATLLDVEGVYGRLYEDHVPLLRFLRDAEAPAPKQLQMAAEFVLQNRLKRALEEENPEPKRINALTLDARSAGVALDPTPLEFSFRKSLEHMARQLRDRPMDPGAIQRISQVLEVLAVLPFTVNLRTVQNICYEIKETTLPLMLGRVEHGELNSREWVQALREMCEKLWVKMD